MSEARGILRVLEAYAETLGLIAGAVSYLFFLTAALLGAFFTGLAFHLLRPIWLAFLTMAATFVMAFIIAGYSSSILWRLHSAYELQRVPLDERPSALRRWRRSVAAIWVGWAVAFAVAFPPSLIFPFPICVAVAVSLGVGLGNLITFVTSWAGFRELDLRPLLVALYLFATIPTYFALPELTFTLLSGHLIISYFGVAVSYTVAARRKVVDVLRAAG